MLVLTQEVRFEAAHRLPNSDGPCRNLHGHSYRVVVDIAAERPQENEGPEDGMIIDFGVIKQIIRKYDHTVLNEEEPFLTENIPPTAEYLAWVLGNKIMDELKRRNPEARLLSVVVWEAEGSAVSFVPDYSGRL